MLPESILQHDNVGADGHLTSELKEPKLTTV